MAKGIRKGTLQDRGIDRMLAAGFKTKWLPSEDDRTLRDHTLYGGPSNPKPKPNRVQGREIHRTFRVRGGIHTKGLTF